MNYKIFSLLSILLLLLVACGSDEPSAYGAYLKDGNRYTEIPQLYVVFGEPDEEELTEIPKAADRQPVITLWHPDVAAANLLLESGAGQGEYIPFSITPRGEEGIVDIQPKVQLNADTYCLIQGDPFDAFLITWCFEVGDNVASSGGQIETGEPDVAITSAADDHHQQPPGDTWRISKAVSRITAAAKIAPRATKVKPAVSPNSPDPISTAVPSNSITPPAAGKDGTSTALAVARKPKSVGESRPIQTPEFQPTRKPSAVLLTLSEKEEIEAAIQYGRKNFYNFTVFINGHDCKLPDNAFPVIKATHALVQDSWQIIEYNELPDCNSDQTCSQVWPYANIFIFDYMADWQSILDANNCGTYESPSVP